MKESFFEQLTKNIQNVDIKFEAKYHTLLKKLANKEISLLIKCKSFKHR